MYFNARSPDTRGTRSRPLGRWRQWICVFASCWLLLSGSVARGAEVDRIGIPSSLGTVQERHPGRPETPLVFVIGEDHVNLDVQRAVAELIGFLRAAYDVRLVMTEGYDKGLESSLGALPLEDRRALARAELDGRRIGAIDYVALYYPDLRIVGIEDMTAYAAHGASMDSAATDLKQRATALNQELVAFLVNDLGQQSGSPDQLQRLKASLNRFMTDGDLNALAATIYEIVGRTSPSGLKLQDIVRRVDDLKSKSNRSLTDTSEFAARDRGMVGNVRKSLDSGKGSAVLVVGSLHLPGIGKGLAEAGIPYVSIRAAGVEEGRKTGSNAGDLDVYNSWKSGKAQGLEAVFERFKPGPAQARSSFQEKLVVTGTLFAIDRRFAVDGDGARAKELIGSFSLPPGLSIADVRGIPGGTQIRWTYHDKVYDARFGPTEGSVLDGDNTPIEKGRLGGRSYAIYDRGGQPPRLPPEPPASGSGGSPVDPFGPSGRFALLLPGDHDNYRKALETRDKSNPGMAIMLLTEQDRRLVRIVDDKVVMLAADPDEVKRLEDHLRAPARAAQDGPGQVYLAQRLSELLLEGIDDQLPPGKTDLTVVVKGDGLGNLLLPRLATFTDLASARRFSQLRTATVAPYESLQTGHLAEIVSWSPPGVDVKHTAVLVDDRARKDRGAADLLRAIKKTGVAVNDIGPDTRDLFVVGPTGGGEWQISLKDGRVLTPKGEATQRALHGVEQVIAYNADGLEAITGAHRLTQQRIEKPGAALGLVRGEVEAVAAESGSGKSLEQVKSERANKDAVALKQALLDKKMIEAATARNMGVVLQGSIARI